MSFHNFAGKEGPACAPFQMLSSALTRAPFRSLSGALHRVLAASGPAEPLPVLSVSQPPREAGAD